MISSPKKVWFHLVQWFQRGLIVKVYRGQRMPNCSNTSHDRYNLHQSCVPDFYHTTEWLFLGNGGEGELLSPKGGSSRCMTTLNEEYKCCVTYCSPLASVFCTLLDFNLLLWIKVITKLPNSEQSYKGKVQTHNYINRQNQSTTGKLWKP